MKLLAKVSSLEGFQIENVLDLKHLFINIHISLLELPLVSLEQ